MEKILNMFKKPKKQKNKNEVNASDLDIQKEERSVNMEIRFSKVRTT